MAKIAITLKILFVWLYHGFASILIQGAVESSINEGAITSTQLYPLIWFSLIMIFLPEIMFITWPVFRRWIMSGVENGDGILHSKDLKELGVLYISLWSMRVFMGFSFAIMFGKDIPTITYLLPLMGSFGTAGLAIIKGVISKR
jgi:hypothetical protein